MKIFGDNDPCSIYPVSISNETLFGKEINIIEHINNPGFIPTVDELTEIINASKNTILFLKKHFDGDAEKFNQLRMAKHEKQIASYRANLPDNPPKKTKIYLMRHGINGLVKIGKSTNPSLREKTLQSEDPMLEKICHSGWVDPSMETNLHRHFSELRVRGEWFNLSDSDIDYIKKRLNISC